MFQGKHAREFTQLLNEWCEKTEEALDDSDGGRSYEGSDIGPDSELIYWRHRAQRLNNVIEQLRQPWVKEVSVVPSVLCLSK